MNIYPPDSIDESKYEHLNQSDFKKIFCTYLTFNKTTLEWYGGETTLNKYLKGYAGSGTGIEEHLKEWKKRLGENWRNNFICLLDECFETKGESKSREGELINDNTRDELCINRLNGGGGWDYGDEVPKDTTIKMKNSRMRYFQKNPNAGKIQGNKIKQYYKNDENNKKPVGEKNGMFGKGYLQLGKNGPRYRHDVSTHSIIKLIIQKTKEKGSKIFQKEWRCIAKQNNSITSLYPRLPEINDILNTNFKTDSEFFNYIFNSVNV